MSRTAISSPQPYRMSHQLQAIILKWYLLFVAATTRWIIDEGSDPPWDCDQKLIALTWHGRQFLGFAALRRHAKPSVLVTSHRDGRLIGCAAYLAGWRVITGSGTHTPKKSIRKRGAAAFRSMVSTLDEHRAMFMTADVPKLAHVAGAGSVKLAQLSGAPIYCFAAITDHRIELKNWNRTQLVLPFGRGVILWSTEIRIARNADQNRLEAARTEIEATLNRLQEQADMIVRTKS